MILPVFSYECILSIFHVGEITKERRFNTLVLPSVKLSLLAGPTLVQDVGENTQGRMNFNSRSPLCFIWFIFGVICFIVFVSGRIHRVVVLFNSRSPL